MLQRLIEAGFKTPPGIDGIKLKAVSGG